MTHTFFQNGPLQQSAYSRNQDGELCCEGLPLAAIAATFGSPTFVYSARMMTDAYMAFQRAAQQHTALICYALKANSNLSIIRLLANAGAGFDIVSLGELQRVLAAGGQPNKIVFSGVGKNAAEIKAALHAKIKCINIESEAELQMVSDIAKAMNLVAPISCRVNPDIDAKTHPYISTGLKENKFGIPMEDALRIYTKAKSLPGISIQGIDCHIGSQITTLQPFLDSLEKVLQLVDRLRAAGITIHHLDLGGGLGICYEDETPPSPEQMLSALFDHINRWADRQKVPRPEVLFEFGRAIVGNAGVLLTKVELLKPGKDKNFAVIDTAMNDLMRPALYEAWHGIMPVSPPRHGQEAVWDLVGPVCESGDWLAKDRRLALSAGDTLAILSAGAYGMSMSSNYNSRPRAAEVLIDHDGTPHLVRRRETFEDLIGPERIPDYLR
jgi:diaminopimelate decarboxylase